MQLCGKRGETRVQGDLAEVQTADARGEARDHQGPDTDAAVGEPHGQVRHARGGKCVKGCRRFHESLHHDAEVGSGVADPE